MQNSAHNTSPLPAASASASGLFHSPAAPNSGRPSSNNFSSSASGHQGSFVVDNSTSQPVVLTTGNSSPITTRNSSPDHNVTVQYSIISTSSDQVSSSRPIFQNSPIPCTLGDSPLTSPPAQGYRDLKSIYDRHPLPLALSATLPDSMEFEPRTLKQEAPHPHWQSAMHEELNAMHKNGTWSLVPRLPTMNVVGSKWIYKVKQRADGTVDRHKARLVLEVLRNKKALIMMKLSVRL